MLWQTSYILVSFKNWMHRMGLYSLVMLRVSGHARGPLRALRSPGPPDSRRLPQGPLGCDARPMF